VSTFDTQEITNNMVPQAIDNEPWQMQRLHPHKEASLVAYVTELVQIVRDGAEASECLQKTIKLFEQWAETKTVDTETSENKTSLFQYYYKEVGGYILSVMPPFGFLTSTVRALTRFMAAIVAKALSGLQNMPMGFALKKLTDDLRTAIHQQDESIERRSEASPRNRRGGAQSSGAGSQAEVHAISTPTDGHVGRRYEQVERLPATHISERQWMVADSFDRLAPRLRPDADLQNLFPELLDPEGQIPQDTRRKSARYASELKLKEPFRGRLDTRSFRTVLLQLKRIAEANAFTSVDYQYLLNFSLEEQVRRVVPEPLTRTYEELNRSLWNRVGLLKDHFGAGASQELVLMRSKYNSFRQMREETLTACVQRFEDILVEMESLQASLTDAEIALQFTNALNDPYFEIATAQFLNEDTGYRVLRDRLLLVEKMRQRHRGTLKSSVDPPGRPFGAPDTHRREDDSRSKRIECFVCNEGHMKTACPIPEGERHCSFCQKDGHIVAACRQKRRTDRPTEQRPLPRDARVVELEILSMSLCQDDNPGDDDAPVVRCRVADSPWIQALADSGAACALMSRQFADRYLPRHTYPRMTDQHYRLNFANMTSEETSEVVRAPVSYCRNGQCVSKEIQFVIATTLKGDVIFGRSALRIIGVSLTFGAPPPTVAETEHISGGDDSVLDHVPVTICMVTAEQEPIVIEDDQERLERLYTQVSYENTSFEKTINRLIKGTLITQPTTSEIGNTYRRIEELLMACVKIGKIAIADDYYLSLKQLSDTDRSDREGQQFVFEISWQLQDTALARRPWNSEHLIQRLDEQRRSEWDDHMETFTGRSWWKEQRGTPPCPISSTIFPVVQKMSKTTTCRPCCDMRAINSISPTVSAQTQSVLESVLRLRRLLNAEASVIQYDLSKAFYRIKTAVFDAAGEQFPISLRAGNRLFTSDRLVFGLSVGPAGLNATQFILERVADQVMHEISLEHRTATVVVMDDFLLIGDQDAATTRARIMEHLWTVSGFEWKTGTWGTDEPNLWLGQQWTFNKDCEKLRLVRTEVDIPPPSSWSKRAAFRAAGKFVSITGGYQEALARLHADAIRQVAGRFEGWDDPCADTSTIKLLRGHLEKAKDHWKQCVSEDWELALFGKRDKLIIETDASQRGWGFVVKVDDMTIFAEARLFGKITEAWHANRREFHALSCAIQRVDSLLAHFPDVRRVLVRTDSKVALAHSSEYRNVSSKALERKVILRMKNSIMEISYMWKTQGIDFRIEHLPGFTNELADRLSRAAYLDTPVQFVEVSHQIDSVRGWPEFKQWLRSRDVFLAWRGTRETDGTVNLLARFISTAQAEDARCRQLLAETNPNHKHYTTSQLNGAIVRTLNGIQQLWIPDKLISGLLKHMHEQMGHTALAPTLSNFYRVAFHPRARRLAKQSIRSCLECQVTNPPKDGQPSYGTVRMPERPFETIGMDLYGPLQRAQGAGTTKKHILTVVDRLTGYTRFILLQNARAESVVAAFEALCYELGAPIQTLVTDNGPQFVLSPLLKGLCMVRGIRHLTLPERSPWMGGFYEIRHRTATRCLRTLLAQFPIGDWHTLTAIAQAKVNSHVGPDRSCSPHELIYGWTYHHPTANALAQAITSREDEWEDPFTKAETEAHARTASKEDFLRLWKEEFQARQTAQHAKFEKEHTGKRAFALGDDVFVTQPTIQRKFAPRAKGPFRLIEQIGKQTWRVAGPEVVLPFRVHTRNLVLAEGLPEVTTEDLERAPSQPPDGVTIGKTDPPGKVLRTRPRARCPPEESFLQRIQGQVSRAGRLRRGSLIDTRRTEEDAERHEGENEEENET
jgi:hypothetical protein